MNGQTKRVLIGAGIAATGLVVAAGAVQTASVYFVKMAMDRDGIRAIEKKFSKLSGTPENTAMLARMNHAAKLLEPHCNKVRMQTKDGLTLVGHWRSPDRPKRIIIAMHGWRSGWSRDFGMIADFWHQNDCAVLFAEQRGQGSSQGKYMGFGLLERHDCRAWIDWVNENIRKDLPIYLAGVSMGASTVLMTAGMDLPANVCGIMADCGYTSADAIWHHVARHNLRISYGIHRPSADALCRKRLRIGTRDYSTLDAMAECEVPVLFIHGTADSFVPVSMTYENYQACAAPKALLVVPGAEHGMSYCRDKAAYEKAMKDFWNTWDKKFAPD